MKICIDISAVPYETGVSWYTRHLVSKLLEIDKTNEYILFGGSFRRKEDLRKYHITVPGNSVSKFYTFPPTLADLVWNRLHKLPIERFVGKIDVFHSSDWTQPPSNAYKVTTIHDLVPIRFPKMSDPKIVSVHKRRLKWVRQPTFCVCQCSGSIEAWLIAA